MQKILIIVFALALNSGFGLQASHTGDLIRDHVLWQIRRGDRKALETFFKCKKPGCLQYKQAFDMYICPADACVTLCNGLAIYCGEECAKVDSKRHLEEDGCPGVNPLGAK
jgi:hypothetical protein